MSSLSHTVQWNSVKLPFPVSDVMANYMDYGEDEDGFVIITGGCDSVKGNERIPDGLVDEETGEVLSDLFACTSTSDCMLFVR